MPTYLYEVVTEDGEEGQVFEYVQRMSDPPLSQHPTTGQPVRRVITAPHVAGNWSDLKTKGMMSDNNLASKGFTKYVKSEQGKYEKVCGAGPDMIRKPAD